MVAIQGRKRLAGQQKVAVRNAAYIVGFVATVMMATVQLLVARASPQSADIQQQSRLRVEPAPEITMKRVSEVQKKQALEYVKSFDNKLGKQLSFFHVPKTAGTSIEHAAGTQNIAWGSCMFPHKPKRNICHYPPGKHWPDHIGWWHLPAFLFPLAGADPYQNTELFGVIRDPYDRMLSEYFYICSLKVLDWRPDQCDRSKLHDTAYMNEWIRTKLLQRNRTAYLADNGHFTSQYDFVYGPHQVRMLDYVLKMEDLGGPFQALMGAFGMDKILLEKRNALGAAKRQTENQVDPLDLLEESTIRMIQEVYREDFEFGRYDISRPMQPS